MDRPTLEKRVSVARELSERVASRSLLSYLNQVTIASRPEPRRFHDCADPWQKDLLRDYLIPPLEYVSGLRTQAPPHQHVWLTLPRGHDKTGVIARLVNGLLGFSKKPLNCYAAAADLDQASLLIESMAEERELNSWLQPRITIGRKRADSRYGGGYMKLLTADAASSSGLKPDVVICDELTWWAKEDLWSMLWAASAKRPGCVYIIITNAGTLGSWQHRLKVNCESSSKWKVFESPEGKQLASWMRPEDVAEMRKGLPRGLARRVVDNVWISPGEESGFITAAELDACEDYSRGLGLTYALKGTPGTQYYAGLDYGPRRDRTALCVLHYDYALHAVIIDRLDVMQGTPETPVQITAVERWLDEINGLFNRPILVVDPYQLEGTIQRYEATNIVERFEARGGKKTYEMCEALRTALVNKRLAWYPGAGAIPRGDSLDTLKDELLALVLKPMTYGYRFDHTAGHHDDRAVAVGMPLLLASRDQDREWIPPTSLPSIPSPPGVFDYRLNIRYASSPSQRGLYGIEAPTRRGRG